MSLCELTSKEIESISGGTTYGSWRRSGSTYPPNNYGNYGRSTPTRYGRGASTNYGGQANGFVSNTAAVGRGLGQGNCSNGVAGGMIAGVRSGPQGVAIGAFGGAIAGGCFKR
ncbi:hypothetical protein J8Z83_20955 [Yersinia enterocolitica]|uniref:hypothetical protein n=1 Tax=Yersinia enterocolitica TaxID=630 RepID=UPI001C8EB580|nr:hypothetical protein [Yersinia enterocolitica]MBX9477117.1 hypothetical protein [Yersinia enterocolitica]